MFITDDTPVERERRKTGLERTTSRLLCAREGDLYLVVSMFRLLAISTESGIGYHHYGKRTHRDISETIFHVEQVMPHKILRKLNHRNIILEDSNPDGHTVGVVVDGKVIYKRWLGTISRNDAKHTGRPVRLKLARINGYDLDENEYAHGCWVEEGVYAVTDVVIIKDNK